MGLNAKTGRLVVLTNAGGASKAGQPSRGALVDGLVSGAWTVEEADKRKHEFAGFNILVVNTFHPSKALYLTNADPDKQQRSPAFDVLEPTPGGDGLLCGMGNDLLRDEHVKIPVLERGVREALDRLPREYPEGQGEAELVAAARASIADVFSRTGHPPGAKAVVASIFKFLYCGRRRRAQPGMKTTLASLAVVCVLSAAVGIVAGAFGGTFAFGQGQPAMIAGSCVALGAAAAMAAGFWHHWKLQALFVRLPGRRDVWQTESQSCCIVGQSGTVHYAYRSTSKSGPRPGAEGWSVMTVNDPRRD